MPATVWDSTVLGAIQGLTEILPVSRAGHVALAELLFDVEPRGLALDLLLRTATLLATLVMLWPQVRAALRGGFAGLLEPSRFATTPGARDAMVMLLAFVPSLTASVLLRESVQRFSHSPLVIGLGLLVTAGVLIGSRFAKPGREEQPGVVGALVLGAAQGLAALPGLSSIAMTLTLALLFGVQRARAFELSLLISVPATLGALVLGLWAARAEPQPLLTPELLGPAAAGMLAAFLASLAALWLLRRSVAAGRLSWFATWLVPVSLATLALAKAWPHG
jgi:undecaprenyl-diphosphatase